MISEETSEQLDIVPMQIRVIKHIRKVYGCRGCETAPVTADKPAQLIEKSKASPSVLAMLLAKEKVGLSMANYRAGKGDLAPVIAARRELIEARLKQIDFEEQRGLTSARLYFTYGEARQ